MAQEAAVLPASLPTQLSSKNELHPPPPPSPTHTPHTDGPAALGEGWPSPPQLHTPLNFISCTLTFAAACSRSPLSFLGSDPRALICFPKLPALGWPALSRHESRNELLFHTLCWDRKRPPIPSSAGHRQRPPKTTFSNGLQHAARGGWAARPKFLSRAAQRERGAEAEGLAVPTLQAGAGGSCAGLEREGARQRVLQCQHYRKQAGAGGSCEGLSGR